MDRAVCRDEDGPSPNASKKSASVGDFASVALSARASDDASGRPASALPAVPATPALEPAAPLDPPPVPAPPFDPLVELDPPAIVVIGPPPDPASPAAPTVLVTPARVVTFGSSGPPAPQPTKRVSTEEPKNLDRAFIVFIRASPCRSYIKVTCEGTRAQEFLRAQRDDLERTRSDHLRPCSRFE